MGLVSRHLEKLGTATIIVGSARDIVEEVGVARFLFVDFPLGNPIGKPDDRAMQADVVDLALSVLESSVAGRTTVQAPVTWGSDEWRANFMAVGDDGKPLKPDPRPDYVRNPQS